MMPIAARYADVWHCFGPPEVLRGEVGADLAATPRRPGATRPRSAAPASLSLEDDLDDIARTIDAWRDAGFGYLVCGWPSQGRARVEEFAAVLS